MKFIKCKKLEKAAEKKASGVIMPCFPLSEVSGEILGGFSHIATEHSRQADGSIFIFNHRVLKVNIDVIVFNSSKFYVTGPYGETLNREGIIYRRMAS